MIIPPAVSVLASDEVTLHRQTAGGASNGTGLVVVVPRVWPRVKFEFHHYPHPGRPLLG